MTDPRMVGYVPYASLLFRRTQPLEWGRDTAYATGLIASDGYLSEPRFVGFGSTDLEFVETVLRCVGRPIRYSTMAPGRTTSYGGVAITSRLPYYQTLCNDPLLYEFLTRAGLGPRKSRSIGALNVPVLHLPDAIRGLLDGDGSLVPRAITTTKRGKPFVRHGLSTVFYSSSRAHLEWLQQVLANLAIRSSLYEDLRRGHSYRLTLSNRQSTALLTTLYEDPRAPRLKRKWSIWQRYREARNLPEYTAFL